VPKIYCCEVDSLENDVDEKCDSKTEDGLLDCSKREGVGRTGDCCSRGVVRCKQFGVLKNEHKVVGDVIPLGYRGEENREGESEGEHARPCGASL